MDADFEKRFIAAVRKGLTDEMVGDQMDLTLDEVREYKQRLLPHLAERPEPSEP